MKNHYSSIIILLLVTVSNIFGQNSWSLRRCIHHADNNNLQIKQTRLNQELADTKIDYTRKDLYPTAQFSLSPTLAIGRSLDPTTYQYATNGFVNNIINITSNQVVWAGGRKKNTYQQSLIERDVLDLEEQKSISNIAIQITQAYFQILLNKVYVKNAERQLSISQEQLEIVKKTAPKTANIAYNLLEWQAQVANDEYSLLKLKNDLKAARINLGTLLDLPDPAIIDVEDINDNIPIAKINPKNEYDLFYKLSSWHPITKITQLNHKVAGLQYDNVKASSLPTISLAVGVSLPFSSLFQEVDKVNFIRNDTIPIFNAGQLRLALSPRYDYTYKTTSIFSQWRQLASSYVGFQISIPLVTGGLHSYQVKQAISTIETSQISMQQAKKELYKEAVFTHNNLSTAISQHQSAIKNLEVWQQYFNTSSERYQKGEITTKEFESIKNNYFLIVQNETVAKYDLIMKRKIYTYYATGDISALN